MENKFRPIRLERAFNSAINSLIIIDQLFQDSTEEEIKTEKNIILFKELTERLNNISKLF